MTIFAKTARDQEISILKRISVNSILITTTTDLCVYLHIYIYVCVSPSHQQARAMQRDERNKSAFHGNNGTYPFAIKPRYCNFLLGSSAKTFATRFPRPRFLFSLLPPIFREERRTPIKIISGLV